MYFVHTPGSLILDLKSISANGCLWFRGHGSTAIPHPHGIAYGVTVLPQYRTHFLWLKDGIYGMHNLAHFTSSQLIVLITSSLISIIAHFLSSFVSLFNGTVYDLNLYSWSATLLRIIIFRSRYVYLNGGRRHLRNFLIICVMFINLWADSFSPFTSPTSFFSFSFFKHSNCFVL